MQGTSPGGRAAIPFAAGHPSPSLRAFAHDARRAASHEVARARDKAGGRGALAAGPERKVEGDCELPSSRAQLGGRTGRGGMQTMDKQNLLESTRGAR